MDISVSNWALCLIYAFFLFQALVLPGCCVILIKYNQVQSGINSSKQMSCLCVTSFQAVDLTVDISVSDMTLRSIFAFLFSGFRAARVLCRLNQVQSGNYSLKKM